MARTVIAAYALVVGALLASPAARADGDDPCRVAAKTFYLDDRIELLNACLAKPDLPLDQQIEAEDRLAGAFHEKGNDKAALAAFDRAIALNPKLTASYEARSRLFIDQGNYDKALSDLNKAIELSPKEAIAYDLRATVYFLRYDWPNTIADETKTLSLAKPVAGALDLRGMAYQNMQHYTKAIADYTSAIRLDVDGPISAQVFNNRGSAYAAIGNCQNALADLDDAIALNSMLTRAYSNKAHVLATCPEVKFRNGAEAVKLAKQALDFITTNPVMDGEAHIALAEAYAEIGQFADAIREQRTAIDLIGDQADAKAKKRLVDELAEFRSGEPFRWTAEENLDR